MPEPRPALRALINPARRSLRIAGVLSAGLLTGAEKLRNGFGNGDSLLIDVSHRVFAVADAGERFPDASRHLLQRLERDLDRQGPPADGPSWQARIAVLWKTQPYVEKTTLSIVAVQPQAEGGCRLLITHGGDSRIAVVGTGNGRVHHRTVPDMNFAGRSLQPPVLQTLAVDDPSARIVLATDGLNDLFRPFDDQREPSIPLCLRQPTVDEVVDAVYHPLRSSTRPYDDAGLILLAPLDLDGCPEVRVLISARPHPPGGAPTRQPVDVWIARDRWHEAIEDLQNAGIRIHLPASATKEQP